MNKQLFSGACTALITPFCDGKIDYKSLDALIEYQIDSNIDAIVISGTTGESPTLSYSEHRNLIKHAAKRINGRTKLIAGTGSNDTAKALKMSKYATEYGADGLLVVTPYYNKANKKGLIAHYEEIAKGCDKPIIVYNVPTRTCVNITPDIYKELEKIENICGIKEASPNISDMAQTANICTLPIYCGNDDLLLPALSLGACGIISVMSNIFPKQSLNICTLFSEGDIEGARKIYFKYLKFAKLLFSDINPAPIKAALAHAGFCKNQLRLPMVRADKLVEEEIVEEYKKLVE